MIEVNKVYHEPAESTMEKMDAGSIDLTVTSPPYDKQRIYDGFLFNHETIASGLWRVTADGGVVVWVVADAVKNGSETGTSFRQALYFMSLGFRLHDTMIYQKRNFSNPEKTRYHSVWEYMFVFSKGKPKTFNPIKDRKNLTAGQQGNRGRNTVTQRDGSKYVRAKRIVQEYGMRHNVWLGNTRGQEDFCIELKHPAMMPRWVARDHIRTWSNPGDVVYDPMGGSGTTAEEAEKLGRKWIISECSERYVGLANANLTA